MKPKISIIAVTYNHEKFISECIRSVLKQTFTDWEMIIIDDASIDATSSIINNFVKDNEKIKFIQHVSNWGIYRLADTYNQALDLARGEFIAVIEGDDYWPEYKLEKQINYFNDPEIGFSYGKCLVVSSQNEPIHNGLSDIKSWTNIFFNDYKGYLYNTLLLNPSFIPSVTIMMRKKALAGIGKFAQPDNIPVVDYPTLLRLSFETKSFGSSENLGFYRRHSYNQSMLNIVEIHKKAKDVALSTLRKMKSIDKEINLKSILLEKKIYQNWSKHIIYAYWIQGRLNLVKSKRRMAFAAFLEGLKEGSLLYFFMPIILLEKMKCIIGILSIILGINLEKILNLIRNRRISVIETLKK